MCTGPLAFVFAVLLVASVRARDHQSEALRFTTSRASPIVLPLPCEEDAFFFVVFGDRTGGPRDGVKVLAEAVADVNVLEPDLVMTVGDLVQGYNQRPEWLEEMREFKGIMNRLRCPWFPVAGNHDIYWRGEGQAPQGEHETDYEEHFGPLWYAFRHKSAWFFALYSDEGDPASGKKDFDDPLCQRMSPEQIAWLEATLAKARAADHVFLFLHHPRWLRRNYGDDWDRVHALLAAAGNVSAVFAGHIHHMRYDGKKDGIEYFALATVGGVQDGFAAEAGYLHQYHVVTVRKSGIAVAAFPVGSAMDPRAITGVVSDEVRDLARALIPRWGAKTSLAEDFSVDGTIKLTIPNPTKRAIEITFTPESADSRWRFVPDHQHGIVEPGQTGDLVLRLQRPAHAFDDAFRMPRISVQVDYLAEGLRVPLPERVWDLPLEPAHLRAPPVPAEEFALELDGVDDCLAIESSRLALADGPFTVEVWVCAREFPERAGLACKTESSEYGLFVGAGKPGFSVHLDGRYVVAQAPEPLLTIGRWHHVAGVFDGEEVSLHVDGVRVAAKRGRGKRTPNDLPLVLGADVGKGGSANSFLPGRIDELRLSRVARYAGERFEPARRFESDADTLLLFHMDGRVGPWQHDGSGHASHAIQRGVPLLVPRLP